MPDRHVRRSGDDYASALMNLLPQGLAWPRQLGTVLRTAVEGLTQIFGFFDNRAADLLETESDPRSTYEMLLDWERNWGLPDPCLAEPLTLNDRRNTLVAKMTLLGGQSRAFFIAAAAAIGYTITITEYSPYLCGISRCGDTRSALDNPDDPTRYRWQLGPPELRYQWTVHVTALRLTYFRPRRSETGVDRLLSIGYATDLECLLRRWKPAHTELSIDYFLPLALDFTAPIDTQYLAIGIM